MNTVGGSKWDREPAAFTGLYRCARRKRLIKHALRAPFAPGVRGGRASS